MPVGDSTPTIVNFSSWTCPSSAPPWTSLNASPIPQSFSRATSLPTIASNPPRNPRPSFDWKRNGVSRFTPASKNRPIVATIGNPPSSGFVASPNAMGTASANRGSFLTC